VAAGRTRLRNTP